MPHVRVFEPTDTFSERITILGGNVVINYASWTVVTRFIIDLNEYKARGTSKRYYAIYVCVSGNVDRTLYLRLYDVTNNRPIDESVFSTNSVTPVSAKLDITSYIESQSGKLEIELQAYRSGAGNANLFHSDFVTTYIVEAGVG